MRIDLLGSAAVALCLCATPGAWAQSAVPTAGRSGQLQEVVVTAQRRAQNIQKTAIPITAISGAELKAQAKTTLSAVLIDVPSIQIQSNPAGADIVLRGVGGNDTGGIQEDPDVAVMEDNVYTGQADSVTGSLYDVQRVEVLRGPQGTLYGRNAAGGVVNILTNDPAPKFGAALNLGYGNLDLRHADGYVNVPITDVLALRVAADIDARHGDYSNGGGAIGNSGARVKLKYTPTPELSILGRFDYFHQLGLTETTAPVTNPGLGSGNCGGPPCFLFAPANPKNPWDTAVAAGSPFAVYPVFNKNDFYTFSAEIDYDLGFGTVTLIPSFTRSSQIQSTASLFAPTTFPLGYSDTTDDQWTGEARINSPAASPFKWVGGVFVLQSNANESGPPPGATTGPYAQIANNERPAKSVGGFAQATYPVLDTLRLTLGGRYNVDNKAVDNYGVCSSPNGISCGEVNGVYYASPISNLTASYSSFTYKAGLEYDITPTAMGYAQVSTGYKAGGFSTATVPPTSYQPESLIDYELGFKSRWLDNTLQFNADAYIYQYKNQQIELHVTDPDSDFLPGDLAGDDTTDDILDVNAGNSRYYGVEEQAKYQVTPNDQINFNIAWEQANYGHFVIDTNPAGQPPGGDYYVNGVAQGSYNLSGQTEAHAPKWNGSAGYQHVFDLPDGDTVTFLSDTHFQSKSYTTIQEWFANGDTIQPAYHQTDLYLNYASGDGHYTAGLWVKNLENNAVVSYVYPLYKETLDDPRTYGVTLGYTY